MVYSKVWVIYSLFGDLEISVKLINDYISQVD